MGGVPDAQESLPVPTTEPIHPDVKNFDVIPRFEVLHRGFGDQFGHLGTEGLDSAGVQLWLAAFSEEASG